MKKADKRSIEKQVFPAEQKLNSLMEKFFRRVYKEEMVIRMARVRSFRKNKKTLNLTQEPK